MNKRFQHGDISVQTHLAPNLPLIQAVQDQIAQVFLNLLINAVEAMSDGGKLIIRSAITRDGRWITVSFTDNGPGMDGETRANIFEPFFTTKRTGTGLGLAISYGIIERHSGQIEVVSAPGKGSTFTVRLPIAKVAQAMRRPIRVGGK
jgi:signal transduction histidine kinase